MSEAGPMSSSPAKPKDKYEEPAGAGKKKAAEGRVIQSVDRALKLIEVIAGKDRPILLNELARAAELNLSTCHHLVATLVARGYVIHAGRSRGYMLSSKLADLAALASREFDLCEFVHDELQGLNVSLRESVQLAVLRDSILMTRLKFGSLMPTHVEPDEVKKMRAAHATATGKAILAWLPETELARVVSNSGLTPFTASTITSLSALIEELRIVRRSGFAVDDEELEPNVICYGAALRDGSGAVLGSISVSIPKSRATTEYRAHMIRAVIECAGKLSNRLRVGQF
ncbi:MAG TPA: IclR family transcriptional regulator [Aurantimonas coralicida]|uniref:IclR family transcriptional regulator n=2 Tax=root TaxID=1 RepID=A0A9C9TIJ4_9HYPH|nr:IclR family transcriptional regulator [Aurantimonas coralicida]HEU02432.1 IclR family transcriptional regulator [Aurantimonas coralicida]